jgi:multimeric flavodoxin WrbA
MSIAVVYYSLTGNNKTLAVAAAKELSAELIEISEKGSRKTGTILLDMILNRTPRVQPLPSDLEKYEHLLFIAPVWMGKAASPLRAYLKHLKGRPQPYAFASISGGALNTNPGLAGNLEKMAGAKPAALVDLHISDLLPHEPKPTMKDTSSYRLNDAEAVKLAGAIAASVKSAGI